MNTLFHDGSILDIAGDLAVFGVSKQPSADVADLDARLGGGLDAWLKERKFVPNAGEALLIPALGRIGATSVILISTGTRSRADLRKAVVDNIVRKDQEERPDLIVLTPTCTSSILQEDLANFVQRASLDAQGDVMLADVNHYRVNELQAADRTLQQIVQFYLAKARKQGTLPTDKTEKPSVNIIGLTTLGFHNNHDCRELRTLMTQLGIEVNLVMPEGAAVTQIKDMGRAWFNLVPYREIGPLTAEYLKAELGMPYVDITPMGIVETARCIRASKRSGSSTRRMS